MLVNWDKLKRQEKGQRTTADAMDSVARSLPALWRADKLQSKAAKAGFEFPDVSGALDKLDEETQELRSAVESGTNLKKSSAMCCLLPSRSAASAASTPRRRFQRPAKIHRALPQGGRDGECARRGYVRSPAR